MATLPVASPQAQTPPAYCQYAGGQCDQSFAHMRPAAAFFAFASEPTNLAATVDGAVAQLVRSKPNHRWQSWTELRIAGQIIFCEICRAIRFARVFVADVTVLNFNVLFELGYALGLEKPLRLLRDPSYERDARAFEELGIFDTIGYEGYSNSDDIVAAALRPDPRVLSMPRAVPEYRAAPIYVVLPGIETEGVARLTSSLKQSAFGYRTFDPKEAPRLALSDLQRHVMSSSAVVVPLLDISRAGALVHNARCAFIGGLALARGLHVLMIQEGQLRQPIDYRDICRSYSSPQQIQPLVERLVKQVASTVTSTSVAVPVEQQRSHLAQLDLGDLAAENEDAVLGSYFIKTAQYQETLRGHARLVVGRKGTGKSAIFSQLRDTYSRRAQDYLVVDLRPEGYQLRKLVELLRSFSEPGTQEQVAVTLWYFVLLSELARTVIERDVNHAYRDPATMDLFKAVEHNYEGQFAGASEDFSDRLLDLVSRIADSVSDKERPLKTGEINAAIWKGDLGPFAAALAHYLNEKREVWIVVDNLDKSWPARGATSHEMLVLRALLEASRKVQRYLARGKVPMRTVVFIRNDIHEALIAETPDRGKESVVNLDHNDDGFLRNIIARRASVSLGSPMEFDGFATRFFELHVGGEDTFRFLFRHTFGRPRDVIRLIKRCVETAVNRNHSKVTEDDVRTAANMHSDDVLRELVYEIRDSLGDDCRAVEEFVGARNRLIRDEVTSRLASFAEPHGILRALLWYSFLGIVLTDGSEAYSYQEQYDVERMLRLAKAAGEEMFVVHPAFRAALHTVES